MKEKRRVAIVFDGKAWHVRRVWSVTEDMERGHMVYRCDKPISNDHESLADVPQVRRLILKAVKR